jgi:ubiquinol-cytochrome c reductase cytochrome b subunit
MFIKANFIISPVHIVPEWYYLFAYAILRAIPNKLLGVIAMLASILVILGLSYNTKYNRSYDRFSKLIVFILLRNLFLLSWLGRCLVESPYTQLSLIITIAYFSLVIILYFI